MASPWSSIVPARGTRVGNPVLAGSGIGDGGEHAGRTGLGVPGNGTPALMLGAIGVVYGDSGTSPL